MVSKWRAKRAPRTSSLPALLGRELPKYFTRDEAREIIGATSNHRDKLMMEIMWQTRLRVSELPAIKPEDLDFHAGVLRAPMFNRRRLPTGLST